MAARFPSSCRWGCPHAALIPIYWDLAGPVRLPLPITPCVNDRDVSLRWIRAYTDPQGAGKNAQGVSGNTVMAATPANNAPEFASDTDSSSIAENSAAGTSVGLAVTATDADSGDTLTYSLSGADVASFAIGASTGQITVGTGTILDYETKASYTVTVTATDTSNATDTITVTINVTNEEEAGAVALSPAQPVVGMALTATLTDPDGSISGTTWVWASSTDGLTAWTDISSATSASYTPVTDDVGKYLRATATYADGHASGKSAQGVSANQVLLTTLELDKATLLAAKPILEGTGTALNWATDVDIANWDGINLYDDTGVKIIDLNDHGLTGSIAVQLGDLAYLETLKLWSSSANNPANQFSGGIPA